MSAGFPRDTFTEPLILSRPIERIEDRELTITQKKSIGLGVLAVIGIIGYLVFKK